MPSARKQKAKARRSREADLVSDLDNIDAMIGNTRVDEKENKAENDNRNSETRVGSSYENKYRIYTRAAVCDRPITSELLEQKLETKTSGMNARISQELDGLLFSMITQSRKP